MKQKTKKLKVGDLVRLSQDTAVTRGHVNTTGMARIERFYDDIPGGVRLDKLIGGFYSWNIDDLVRVK